MPRQPKPKSDKDQLGKRVKIDLFGDVHTLRYEPERKRIEADVLMSPTDIRRLLNAMQAYYAGAKNKRGKQISDLSGQLAKLVEQECSFFAEGAAFVAQGPSVHFGNEKEYIFCDDDQ